ncbi:MAG: hypothetical protein CSB33_00360 [Desulfobacterales bacterium]|nr:MAG: hypothetical protein CSB33_00360 [Desulfobacterales bacterium]
MAEAIHYSDFTIEDDTEYFLYVGELKNYGINHFLAEALQRILNRKFQFIAIVPDVFEQYNYENLIVINPVIRSYACRFGENVNCRVSSREFITAVSASKKVRALIRRLLRRQDHLYIHMYESLPEMTLDEMENVSILGPDKQVANRLNNKIFQFEGLSGLLPTVDYKVCRGWVDLEEKTGGLWNEWADGVVISAEYSAAGVNSIVARNPGDMHARFQRREDTYLVTRYIPHEFDPTVLAVVAGDGDVYIAGVADQRIADGTRFTGSVYPSRLPGLAVEKLKDYTRAVGEWMAGQGYRGIYGCDYLVAPDGDIRFLEINARKQGTTLEFCCLMDQSLPSGAPNLPEMEYYAVTEGVLPVNAVEIKGNPATIYWGTYNYKIADPVITADYIPHSVREREAFARVAAGKLKKDFLILEHAGADFIVAEGAFIGRIVALGHDYASVEQGLRQGRRTIDLTISENPVVDRRTVM